MGAMPDAAPADASSSDERTTDGEPDAGSTGPKTRSSNPSEPITISLLPSPNPLLPFQQAAEVSIAAHNGRVMIAAINLHTDASDTLTATPLLRGVGVATSSDWGNTFGPTVNPGFVATETSDPVVRASADGSFWLAAIGIESAGLAGEQHRGWLLRALPGRQSFAVIHDDLPVFDKEWIAPGWGGGLVMGAEGGFWRFTSEGIISASWIEGPDWPVFGAFDDARGVHFVIGGAVALWTGAPDLVPEGHLRSPSVVDNGWSVPIGALSDGGVWAVYGAETIGKDNQSHGTVIVRQFRSGDLERQDVAIGDAGAMASFMPAAAMDDEGRLHVIWYDSSGASGVLKYARSISTDLDLGFSPAQIVDPDACPGAGWFPAFAEGAPDRRLREYIDLAIDARRVHMAWTHAPTLPSRIQTSHLDF